MGFIDLKELDVLEIAKGINAKVITAETTTVLHVRLAEGAVLPEHSHHHEQVINLIEGELELVVDGETFNLKSGTVFVLEPNIIHSGKVLSDSKIVDVFHPVRKDFIGDNFKGYKT